ncbi:hypothetical protein ACOMHN_066063 [Nucella lapillus]
MLGEQQLSQSPFWYLDIQSSQSPFWYLDIQSPFWYLDIKSSFWYLDIQSPFWYLDIKSSFWYLDIKSPFWYLDIKSPFWYLDIQSPFWYLDIKSSFWYLDIQSSHYTPSDTAKINPKRLDPRSKSTQLPQAPRKPSTLCYLPVQTNASESLPSHVPQDWKLLQSVAGEHVNRPRYRHLGEANKA